MSTACLPLSKQEQSLESTPSIESAIPGTERFPTAYRGIQCEPPNEPFLPNGNNNSSTYGVTASKDCSDNENRLSDSNELPPFNVERTHYCHKCKPPRAFQKKHQLTTHQRRHDPPFGCDQPGCSKRFQYRKDLTRHLKTVHAKHDLDIECFPCPVHTCEWSLDRGHRGFTRPDSLRRHVQKVHKISSESPSGDTS